MQRAGDREVLDLARTEERVLLSADTDFGMTTILATTSARAPSVTGRRPAQQAALLLANLAAIEDALDAGSVIVLEEGRMGVRRPPIVE